ncbi:MAG TPA: ATP-binding protein [Burkholderiaceae bacterium]|nr:ATP-binding protein [Burkholderiaceae bacterium]
MTPERARGASAADARDLPTALACAALAAAALLVAAAPWPAPWRLLAMALLVVGGVAGGCRYAGPVRRRDSARTGDEDTIRFLVNLVHELRTPLALVDGPLQQLARMPRLEPHVRDHVNVARQNCLRLMSVAEDLLELARADRGQRPLDARPLVLREWLRELAAAVARHPALGRRVLHEEFPDDATADDDVVMADPRALERVFLNLVGNAIKFGVDGHEIRIGTVGTGRDAGFYVADDGIGIAPAHHASIFERFRQVDGSATRRFGGVGIGLALARELTESMGGRIELASAPGAGARFTVWLPRAAGRPPRRLPAPRPAGHIAADEPDAFERILRVPGVAAAVPTPGVATDSRAGCEAGAGRSPGPGADASAPGSSRPRVVVVEDEPELRWLVESALRDEFDVVGAGDGRAGLQALIGQPAEILLTDWMLPGLDGLELASRARGLAAPPRVVLITARMNEAERVAALRLGVDDFLAKPFSLAELGARLRNLAQRVRAERALRAAHDGLARAQAELEATRAALIHDEKLKSIGYLSAGLVHEIHNPVNFMRTATELLRRSAALRDDPKSMELLASIEHGLARVGTIIGDLRVFAFRDDAAGQAPRRLAFDASHAIQAAVRLCRRELGSIAVDADVPSLQVVGAESQVVQVLVNLLCNSAAALAARAAERTPGAADAARIVVRLDRGERQGGRRIWIRVRDNGEGIAPDVLPRLLEPFFTTRGVGQGLGLGLAVSSAIVRRHGGELTVTSSPGQGAEFSFDLEAAG